MYGGLLGGLLLGLAACCRLGFGALAGDYRCHGGGLLLGFDALFLSLLLGFLATSLGFLLGLDALLFGPLLGLAQLVGGFALLLGLAALGFLALFGELFLVEAALLLDLLLQFYALLLGLLLGFEAFLLGACRGLGVYGGFLFLEVFELFEALVPVLLIGIGRLLGCGFRGRSLLGHGLLRCRSLLGCGLCGGRGLLGLVEAREGVFLVVVVVYLDLLNGHLAFVAGVEHNAFGHLEAEGALVVAGQRTQLAEVVVAGAFHLVGEGVDVVEPHLLCHVFAHAFAFGEGLDYLAFARGLRAVGYDAAGGVVGACRGVVVCAAHNAV